MQNNSERNNALRDQNEELASKMKHLVEQYEQREEHIDKILKHKDLELQLVQAKLDKADAEKKELAERGIKERDVLLAQTLESVKKNQVLNGAWRVFASVISLRHSVCLSISMTAFH